jgi:hypothetical protein
MSSKSIALLVVLIFLGLCMMLIARSIIKSDPWGMPGPKRDLRVIKAKMRLLQRAVTAYSLKPQNEKYFPEKLDNDFASELSKAALVEHIGVGDLQQTWFVIQPLSNEPNGEEAAKKCVAMAKKSEWNHVIYCPIKVKNNCVSYRILAIDKSGNLLRGIRGDPLALSP